jgi:hypothetical protein
MQNNRNIYGGDFCNPNEKLICTIGTGYAANYVSSNRAERAGATLTNRRVYFSGNVFTRNDKGRFIAFSQRKIVNNRDITGTGYDFYRPLHLITAAVIQVAAGFFSFLMNAVNDDPTTPELVEAIFSIAGWPLIILGVICGILYFVHRKTLMFIEYAGGNIAFDLRWIQSHEQDNFIRNIHLAKDNIYGTAAVDQGFINTPPSPIMTTPATPFSPPTKVDNTENISKKIQETKIQIPIAKQLSDEEQIIQRQIEKVKMHQDPKDYRALVSILEKMGEAGNGLLQDLREWSVTVSWKPLYWQTKDELNCPLCDATQPKNSEICFRCNVKFVHE